MKYFLFNRQSLLFSSLLATACGLNAQITSTHTDNKYNYTTVVYKDTAVSDKAVLAALENSMGMGDVVRVTVAPPKPAVVPTTDRSKGEDTWLKPVKAPINTMTAGTTPMLMNDIPTKAPAVAPKPTVAPKVVPATQTKPVAAANASTLEKKAVNVPKPVVAPAQQQTEQVVVTPKTSKTTSAVASKNSKSANKSLKKGGVFKMKSRKKGKQRYGCPKF